MKAFFHVQHLLGIGHLKRAATLAGALAREGFEVTLASGGMPVAGIVPAGVKLAQLPPAASEDASFKHLVDERGRRVDDAWRERRKIRLLETYEAIDPELLLIELFPFGRRQFAFELLPLLERARDHSSIACSVRDIIQDKPSRHEEMLALAERYFDLVLVHGDARMAAFPLAAPLRGKLRYTGYVVEEPATNASGDGRGEVIVSAGGGSVGRILLETAIAARPLSVLRERTWRILTGVNGSDLASLAGSNLIVESFRADFRTLLANCELSISQAGYNTVMETLQARARAVLVPFAAGGESEQSARARLLAERGLAEVVEETELDPVTLAAAVDRAARRERPPAGAVDLGGAARSVALLNGLLGGKRYA